MSLISVKAQCQCDGCGKMYVIPLDPGSNKISTLHHMVQEHICMWPKGEDMEMCEECEKKASEHFDPNQEITTKKQLSDFFTEIAAASI